MIEITATGDTTLHTAGKYCAEDILVKVPAGSETGGAYIETCTVEVKKGKDGSGVSSIMVFDWGYFTCYQNGVVSYGEMIEFGELENVVVGTVILITLSYEGSVNGGISVACDGISLYDELIAYGSSTTTFVFIVDSYDGQRTITFSAY